MQDGKRDSQVNARTKATIELEWKSGLCGIVLCMCACTCGTVLHTVYCVTRSFIRSFVHSFIRSFVHSSLSAQHGTCKHRERRESRHNTCAAVSAKTRGFVRTAPFFTIHPRYGMVVGVVRPFLLCLLLLLRVFRVFLRLSHRLRLYVLNCWFVWMYVRVSVQIRRCWQGLHFRCPLILLLTCSLPSVTPSAPYRRVWKVFQAATVESAASGTDIYISC